MGPGGPLGSSSTAGGWPKRASRRRNRLADVTVSVALPWLVFFLVTSLFLFAYHEMKIVVMALIGLCFCLSLLFLGLGAWGRHPTFLVIGFMCMTSVSVASAVGVWLDGEYLQRYWQLETGSEYKDVNPASDPKSTTGAGVITFLSDAFVDDSRTVGFVADGGIFCVAPVVMPPFYSNKVSFWAVGSDCCQQRSNFDCGAAREPGALQKSALAEPPQSRYSEAIAEAVSVYGLDHQDGVQLVSFVNNPRAVITEMWDQSLIIALAAMIVDLVMCILAGIVIAKVLLPAPRDSERTPLKR